MTCMSCGRPMAAGARYCIHCGAEQAVPTPIAAVAAAAMARGNRREAANAAHADPVRGAGAGVSPRAEPWQVAPAIAFAANSATSDHAAHDEGVRPAYADAPPRRGLAAVFIASCVAVAIVVGAVIAWRMEGERSEATAAAADTSVRNGPAAPSRAPDTASLAPPSQRGGPATSLSPAAEAGTAGASSSQAAVAEAPAAAGTAPSAPVAGTPVEIKPLPPHPGAARPAHRAEPAKSPTDAAAPAAEATAEAPPAPSTAPRTTTAATAAAPAAHADVRWQRMNDELSRCTREDFITRVICGQRVRFRYCDGYWGKVPACPGNPTPERGQ